MMPKLKAIPRALEPNQKIINLLRECLRDAKEGRVHALGLAVAVVSDDPDSDGARATESILSYTPGWAHSLACAVNGLAFRLNYERYAHGSPLPVAEMKPDDE
jgi:hypothetical protein